MSCNGSTSPHSAKKLTVADRVKTLSAPASKLLSVLSASGILNKTKTAQLDLVDTLESEQFQPAVLQWLIRDTQDRVAGPAWRHTLANALGSDDGRRNLVDRYYENRRESMLLDHHFEPDIDKKARGFAVWWAKQMGCTERDAYEQRIAERYDELVLFSGWKAAQVPERYRGWLVCEKGKAKEKQG